MAHENVKDLTGRASSDKILLDKANGSMSMFQWFTSFFMWNLRKIMLLSTWKPKLMNYGNQSSLKDFKNVRHVHLLCMKYGVLI